ncbi:hypothetical protein MY11210_008369 [Beauveria gryllotalpidicola]
MFQAPIRFLAFGNHVLVWASSAIVTGILSYFLNKFPRAHNKHIIYEEVIATVTLGLWTFGMILPLINRYGGHLWPVNLVFSYLWLTSFIFSAQDWARGNCPRYIYGFGRCRLKRAVIAFNFIAFFFLLCNALVEGWFYYKHRTERVGTPTSGGRERPDTTSSAQNTAAQNTAAQNTAAQNTAA